MPNKLGELGGNYDNSTVFICHGDCIEDAKYVENILKTKYGVKEVLINYTGAVIGSPLRPRHHGSIFPGRSPVTENHFILHPPWLPIV